MKASIILPTLAPCGKPYLIRKIYESDAAGYLDTDLLDEVGWALYLRCERFIKACEANQGRATCPVYKKRKVANSLTFFGV